MSEPAMHQDQFSKKRNSPPGFGNQPDIIRYPACLLHACHPTMGHPRRQQGRCRTDRFLINAHTHIIAASNFPLLFPTQVCRISFQNLFSAPLPTPSFHNARAHQTATVSGSDTCNSTPLFVKGGLLSPDERSTPYGVNWARAAVGPRLFPH